MLLIKALPRRALGHRVHHTLGERRNALPHHQARHVLDKRRQHSLLLGGCSMRLWRASKGLAVESSLGSPSTSVGHLIGRVLDASSASLKRPCRRGVARLALDRRLAARSAHRAGARSVLSESLGGTPPLQRRAIARHVLGERGVALPHRAVARRALEGSREASCLVAELSLGTSSTSVGRPSYSSSGECSI